MPGEESQEAAIIFWLSSAVATGVGAVTVDKGGRRTGLAIATAVLVITGFAWRWIKRLWPPFTEAITSIATNPETWFILVVIIFCIVIFVPPKRRSEQRAAGTRPSVSEDKPWWDLRRYLLREKPATGVHLGRPELTIVPETVDSTPWKTDIEQLDGDIDQIRKKITDAADQQLSNYRALEGIVGTVEDKIDRQSKAIEQLNLTVKSDYQQANLKFSMVSTAVRARDAIAILKEADSLLSSLGPRLTAANTSDYPDWKKWNTDYALWETAFEKIDDAMTQWKEFTEYQRPYLDLRQSDYKRASNLMPPANIVSDVIDIGERYKNVRLIYPRWEAEREQTFKFLESRANTLPG